MQFKHPEILYALLLLIIPIIVHLFQLQRFQKVAFTNVKFLQKIIKETRKSSLLKKWLVLLMRLLAFTSLIMAFAQPYFSKNKTTQNIETHIYLDNSFSLQAKNNNGEILKNNTQQLIENQFNASNEITLFTSDKNYRKSTIEDLKNELINIEYSSKSYDFKQLFLKQSTSINNKSNQKTNAIIVSDFQHIKPINKADFEVNNTHFHLVKTTPKSNSNFYIDSVYIASKNSTNISIDVVIKSVEKTESQIPVSFFQNEVLKGKSTATFNNTNKTIVTFTTTETTGFNGKISITDDFLEFDNDFYFAISTPEKINVLSIGNKNAFLSKIYTENEFNLKEVTVQNINFNEIQQQQLIVLNELREIPLSLLTSLTNYLNNNGHLIIIPSENANVSSYNRFFRNRNIGSIATKLNTNLKLTTINYEHPVLKEVFEKRVQNFDYPNTSLIFQTNFRNSNTLISTENDLSFISSLKNVYFFMSPLNKKITNFSNSPLIVPIFYNIAKQSLNVGKLYHTISSNTNFDIKTTLDNNDIIRIANSKENATFIPEQIALANKTSINISKLNLKQGFYKVFKNDEVLKTIALNYNRNESELKYSNIESEFSDLKNVSMYNSVEEVLTKLNDEQKINWLFKWFLAFSVLFLIFEMLILKYFKI
jgi:hypothetical protein